MLNKIIRFSLENRILVIVSGLLLLLGGGYIVTQMEIDVFPDLTAPTVVVMTESQGMAPEEVERLVTFPIESSMNGATNVRRVRSSSAPGFSVVWIEFEWGMDIYRARQIVSEKLTAVSSALPESSGKPVLAPQSSLLGEVMLIALTSDSLDSRELRSIADWVVRPRLLGIGGIAQVTVIGGDVAQYQILIEPRRLKNYGLSLADVIEAMQGANTNAAGGVLNEFGNEYLIRGIGRSSEIAEIGENVISVVGDIPVRIRDIAEVRIGSAPRIGAASLNAESAVLLTPTKQPATNTLELVEKIDIALEDLKKSIPPGVRINTSVFRQSTFIEAAIGNISRSLVEGSIMVVVILFLFLVNVRATFITLVAIPLSLLSAVLVMHLLGYTLNTMSLGGMAIAIGSLVDDAIIDVENIIRRLRLRSQMPQETRIPVLETIYKASIEIRSSILNATLIIIAAFIPLFFLSGMEGRMLRPLGVAFLVSLLTSLLVAVTITPALSSFLLTSRRRMGNAEPRLVHWLNRRYRMVLLWVLARTRIVVITATLVVLAAGAVFLTFGRSFLPEFNEGSLVITTVTAPGIGLAESDSVGRQVERQLLRIPEISHVARKTGRAELDEHALGANTSEIECPLEMKERPLPEVLEDVRGKLSSIRGLAFTIGQPIGHRIDHMLSGTRANIAIKLFGPDLDRLATYGARIKNMVEEVPGSADVSIEPQMRIPQIQIRPKRGMMAKYGITIPQLMTFVDVAFAGAHISEVYEGARVHDLVLRYNDANRMELEELRSTLIETGNRFASTTTVDAAVEPFSGKVPLSYVADVVSTNGPNTINRENVQRRIVISANVDGRDLHGLVEAIRERIDTDLPLPEGYRVEYGGQFESEASASRTLLLASLLSLMVIVLLLFQEFRSLTDALIILINLPLALIGGVGSIALTSGVLSIPAIIGFITLFGIATRNGILLVSHYEHLREEGMALKERVINGSVDRLNPILMTALTAGLALIPLAIAGNAPGNEIQSPMATVILGGLLTSVALNMLVLPAVYSFITARNEAKRPTPSDDLME